MGYKVISELNTASYIYRYSNAYVISLTNIDICSSILKTVVRSRNPSYFYVVMRYLKEFVGCKLWSACPGKFRSEFGIAEPERQK